MGVYNYPAVPAPALLTQAAFLKPNAVLRTLISVSQRASKPKTFQRSELLFLSF